MTARLNLILTLPTGKGETPDTAEHPLDLGTLAPSLSPHEIGEMTVTWAHAAQADLINRLREAERAHDRRAEERRESDRRVAAPVSLPDGGDPSRHSAPQKCLPGAHPGKPEVR